MRTVRWTKLQKLPFMPLRLITRLALSPNSMPLTAGTALRVSKMTTKPSQSALMESLAFKSYPEIAIPRFVYGTAWKKDRTASLVYQALKAGFRAIDTAAQPRHYNEAQVGEGIRRAIEEGIVKREDVYIQTKFTPPSGQDPNNMPYSLSQNLKDRIATSLELSLKNFTFQGSEEPYLDCLVLHSPLPTMNETLEAWATFSTYCPTRIRTLGISNTTFQILQRLYAEASIKPSIVQNRFYPDTRWEVPLRKWCQEQGIVFQSFWTLTGNPQLMKSQVVLEVGEELDKKGVQDSKAVALYALVLGLDGISILNGTTNEDRMRNDLEGLELFGRLIEGEWKEQWEGWLLTFKKSIGELANGK